MPYFAMIHWSDEHKSPVTANPEHGHAKLWDSVEDARKEVDAMPIAHAKKITIHDVDGEA
jgi:hypothetical protein